MPHSSSSETEHHHHHHHHKHHHKKKHSPKHRHRRSKSPHGQSPHRHSSSSSSRERERRREKDRDKDHNNKNREKDPIVSPQPIDPNPINPVDPVEPVDPGDPVDPDPVEPVPDIPSPSPEPFPQPPDSPEGNGPFAGPEPESDNDTFNPEEVARSFNKAVKGLGTDEKRIIKELTNHSNEQLQSVKDKYLVMYGKTLKEDLKSDLSFSFKNVCLSLLEPRIEYEAHRLKNAITGIGTDEKCLIDILCTKTGPEINKLKEAYSELYNSDLENDLKNEEPGWVGRLFRSLAVGDRPDSHDVDVELAVKEAQEIYAAGEGRIGTDESKICHIFASRSYSQLQETFNAYSQFSNNDIEDAIKNETSRKFEDALLVIIHSVRNKLPKYFAKRLFDSLKGIGTNDADLIRILVSRSEIDMNEIRKEFNLMFNQDLVERLSNDLSGDYKKIMIKLASR